MADDLDDVEPDPRTLAVPADATVHLRRQDEDRITVDDFGPGSPTVAVMRQSWQGAMRSLTDLGEQVRRLTAERDRLAGTLGRVRDGLASIRGERAATCRCGFGDHCPRCGGARPLNRCRDLWHVEVHLDSTPDAPAGPPSAPVAAQEPLAGVPVPTETQRGAEGDFRAGSAYVLGTEIADGYVPPSASLNPAADVDTVSGASQRREGER